MTHMLISTSSETHAPKTTVVDTASILAPEGQGCPRCGGAVFAAELVLAKGREWHRKCFKCKDCNKTLDSIIACDGPDKDVYCRTCYGKVPSEADWDFFWLIFFVTVFYFYFWILRNGVHMDMDLLAALDSYRPMEPGGY